MPPTGLSSWKDPVRHGNFGDYEVFDLDHPTHPVRWRMYGKEVMAFVVYERHVKGGWCPVSATGEEKNEIARTSIADWERNR